MKGQTMNEQNDEYAHVEGMNDHLKTCKVLNSAGSRANSRSCVYHKMHKVDLLSWFDTAHHKFRAISTK